MKYPGSRKKVSAVAGLGLMPSGRVTEVFRLYDRNLHWEDFVAWLTDAHRHYRRKLIVVWGNLPAHLKAVSAFRDLETSWIEFRQLPSYSPDLSPPEWLWSDVKYHAMANWVPKDVEELYARTHRELQTRKTQYKKLRNPNTMTS